jgi:hypothetical protein
LITTTAATTAMMNLSALSLQQLRSHIEADIRIKPSQNMKFALSTFSTFQTHQPRHMFQVAKQHNRSKFLTSN